MTRAEAIDMAVRRHVRCAAANINIHGQRTFLRLMEVAVRKRQWDWEKDTAAIRAHFRIVSRQYGVRP